MLWLAGITWLACSQLPFYRFDWQRMQIHYISSQTQIGFNLKINFKFIFNSRLLF
jgi:hypothetical protein